MELTHFGTAPGPQPLLLQLLLAGPYSSPARAASGFPGPLLCSTLPTGWHNCLVPKQIRWGVSPSTQATVGLCPFRHPPQVFRPQPATMS